MALSVNIRVVDLGALAQALSTLGSAGSAEQPEYDLSQPREMVLAPLAGHFGTLRSTYPGRILEL